MLTEIGKRFSDSWYLSVDDGLDKLRYKQIHISQIFLESTKEYEGLEDISLS